MCCTSWPPRWLSTPLLWCTSGATAAMPLPAIACPLVLIRPLPSSPMCSLPSWAISQKPVFSVADACTSSLVPARGNSCSLPAARWVRIAPLVSRLSPLAWYSAAYLASNTRPQPLQFRFSLCNVTMHPAEYLAIDRDNCRAKHDKYHDKEGGASRFARVQIDIEHLRLALVPLV